MFGRLPWNTENREKHRTQFYFPKLLHYTNAAVTWKYRTFSRDPNWKRSLYGNDLLQCFSYSWNDLCECCLFLDRFLTTIFCEIDHSQETIFFKNYSLWRLVFYKKLQHTPQLCREIKLKVRIQFEKRSLHENHLLESCEYFWYDLLDFIIFLDRVLTTIFSENDRCRDAIFFSRIATESTLCSSDCSIMFHCSFIFSLSSFL